MEITKLIDEYAAGPHKLRDAIAGMTPEQIDTAPLPGKWSTRQVICHLADFEPVYADRMKHVIAEDQPSPGATQSCQPIFLRLSWFGRKMAGTNFLVLTW